MGKCKVGVLVSGRGTNLQAIIDAVGRGDLPVDVAVVVSNHAGVLALARAEAVGVPTAVLERSGFSSRVEQQRAIRDILQQRGVDLVVLAGFDRVVEPILLAAFPNSVINIHPSLLPAFGGGLRAQADALSYGAKVTGCTVHFVTDHVDGGPIIVQRAVSVLDDDTVDSLSARILEQEHQALVEAVRLVAAGCLRIDGRRVLVKADEPSRQA